VRVLSCDRSCNRDSQPILTPRRQENPPRAPSILKPPRLKRPRTQRTNISSSCPSCLRGSFLLHPAEDSDPDAAEKLPKYFFEVRVALSRRPKLRPKCCIVPQQVFNFATVQKRWASLGSNGQLEPRLALDVRKSPSLRASVGGGQISLTSVLKGDFVHVLLCLFTKPAPLVCSGPALESVSSQKVPSGDAPHRCTPHARGALNCSKNFSPRLSPQYQRSPISGRIGQKELPSHSSRHGDQYDQG
jgi:hypothetical protein